MGDAYNASLQHSSAGVTYHNIAINIQKKSSGGAAYNMPLLRSSKNFPIYIFYKHVASPKLSAKSNNLAVGPPD